MKRNSRMLKAAEAMEVALSQFLADAIDTAGDDSVEPDLQDILWEWALARSELLRILVGMAEAGFSVSITEPHHCVPDEVFKLSEYTTVREFAQAAEKWHDQIDLVEFYFYREEDEQATAWMIWTDCNDIDESVCDYTTGQPLAGIIEDKASE